MSHTVIHADALTYLRGNRWLVQNGFIPKAHAILCDPPYGLAFMGKHWDTLGPVEFQVWVTEWAGLLIDYVYPGAVGLFFGGTRTYHRLAAGLEDAGWEITDCMMWVTGQGFPKSAAIDKLLDKEAGAAREVVGQRKDGNRGGGSNTFDDDNFVWPDVFPVTAPATPLAARWEGYGTALKPSFEPIVIARKPLSFVPFSAIMAEMNTLIGGLLCLSLLSVNDAEKVSTFSPSELPTDAASASVVTLVGLLHGAKSGALYEAMGTFNSPETVSTCLNTALLWNGILAAVSENGSTYTTSTASSLTTALKICKSLILESIPESITQDVIRPLGQLLPAPDAESSLSAGSGNTNDIPMRFAAAIASLPAKLASSIASGVGSLSTPAVKSISTVLNRALTELPTISGESLQPDYLPVVVARAPRGKRTYAALAREFGTGALAIDAARIGTGAKMWAEPRGGIWRTNSAADAPLIDNPQGRFPANFGLICTCEGDDHADDCPVSVLGRQSGVTTSTANPRNNSEFKSVAKGYEYAHVTHGHDDAGTSARFFYQAKAAAWEREAGLHDRTRKIGGGKTMLRPRADLTPEKRAWLEAELERRGIA